MLEGGIRTAEREKKEKIIKLYGQDEAVLSALARDISCAQGHMQKH